jgi:putative nucleotidyltransferase with HDIG domain
LFPAGTTVPAKGAPPSMMNFSMRGSVRGNSSTGRARVSKAISSEVRDSRRIPCPAMAQPTREEAWQLVCEWTESDSLRKHMLGVETAMRAYAREWGEDEELWGVTGLLHDLDYERYPNLDDGHPRKALELFEQLDYPQELIDAVAGHATFLNVPRETRMAKTLYAVDELSGFIAACSYVRPDGIHGMTPKSVKKKLKQPSFAAGVNRDEVRESAAELGVDFDEHVAFVIAAMDERADELGLGARE